MFPGARVRRLATHPIEQSWVVSAVQGNNEVTVWDLETGARRQALWASHTPPLSQTQVWHLKLKVNNYDKSSTSFRYTTSVFVCGPLPNLQKQKVLK